MRHLLRHHMSCICFQENRNISILGKHFGKFENTRLTRNNVNAIKQLIHQLSDQQDNVPEDIIPSIFCNAPSNSLIASKCVLLSLSSSS